MYFVQGLTMGLAYVAPIGMQNLFVINSAITNKRKRAYLTALIVIFFDVTLALACFFGIGVLMEQHSLIHKGILLIGSLIVIYIGIGLIRDKDINTDVEIKSNSIAKTITSACVVTWFNPQAIIDGTMMLGAFRASLPETTGYVFIIGVALASCLWFTTLTTVISIFKKHINTKILRCINIICGIVIVFYGIKLLIQFINMYI